MSDPVLVRQTADGTLVPLTSAEIVQRAKDAEAQLPAVPGVNFLAFIGLFTNGEQAAIVNSVDTRIRLFCLMAAGANFVDLTDPRVIGGTQLLESLGLIGQGRAAQVLAGQAPPTA